MGKTVEANEGGQDVEEYLLRIDLNLPKLLSKLFCFGRCRPRYVLQPNHLRQQLKRFAN